MADYLTAAEAARRLGVKPATLYAYVSRGVLSRVRAPDGRTSLFGADEVEQLARRGRPRRPAGVADITVESAITEITGDSLRFRGLDATRLAVSRTFEEVAELLWTGEFRSERAPWRARPAALAAGRAAQAALPAGTLPLERLQVIVPAMAATDPLRLQLDRPAVIAAGRNIIAGMVDCLPGDLTSAAAEPVAGRLWSRLCAGNGRGNGPGNGQRRPAPGLMRALSAALVLLADHELAASTLAARAAASVRADPYAVVGTGLGAVSGALHGGASLGAETLMAAASGPEDVPRVVAELLRRGEKVPGFGHFVYRGGDPRAILLLDLVRRVAPKSGQLAVADAVFAEVRHKSLPEPNIDFAIATLVRVAGMVRGAGEAIFAVARTAGWIAHALEAYSGPGPLRPRAVYTGRPAADGP
ncbi:MAG TPA: citrate synthase [Streptosporangiaceae bacterium]|nr:citrate synthase [Streptosporangiaceae bacterium]